MMAMQRMQLDRRVEAKQCFLYSVLVSRLNDDDD